jgi:hypothetical protein
MSNPPSRERFLVLRLATAAPRPRDYQMLIMPFTFFWRTLLAKKRRQGLVAKAS